jgi:hypothetical protein
LANVDALGGPSSWAIVAGSVREEMFGMEEEDAFSE